MKRFVDADDVRPAGRPDKCFYCEQPVGAEHAFECVTLTRPVVVRMTTEYVVDVPQSWKAEDINFHRNESSWCAANAVSELVARRARSPDGTYCLECPLTEFEYVRDATDADLMANGLVPTHKP